MSDLGLVVVALAIATGIVGVVVPVLPGSLLAWAAIAVWALVVGSATAWAVLAVATLVIGGAQLVKILVPGRRLRAAGVHRRSILAGVVLAGVGFFLIPVVGFFLGFPLGVSISRNAAGWAGTRPPGTPPGRPCARWACRSSSSCRPPCSPRAPGWRQSWPDTSSTSALQRGRRGPQARRIRAAARGLAPPRGGGARGGE